MRGHFWLAALAALLLAGCFTSSSPPPGKDHRRADGNGLIFGTIGTSGDDGDITQRLVHYRVLGSQTDGSARGEFSYVNTGGGLTLLTRAFVRMPTDVVEGNAKATLFVTWLVPGEYEIYREGYLSSPSGGFAAHMVMRDVVPVRFKVDAGRATYLGQFLSHIQMRRDPDGVPVFAGGYFQVSDRLTRDLELLNARNEGVFAAEAVINAASDRSTSESDLSPTVASP